MYVNSVISYLYIAFIKPIRFIFFQKMSYQSRAMINAFEDLSELSSL